MTRDEVLRSLLDTSIHFTHLLGNADLLHQLDVEQRAVLRNQATEAHTLYLQAESQSLDLSQLGTEEMINRLDESNAILKQLLTNVQNPEEISSVSAHVLRMAAAVVSILTPMPSTMRSLVPATARKTRSTKKKSTRAISRDIGSAAPIQINVMAIHGIGGHERRPDWSVDWQRAVQDAFERINPNVIVRIHPLPYDDLFADAPLRPWDYATEIIKLSGQSITTIISDWWTSRDLGSRGGFSEEIRWYLGMVVQWTKDEKLRAKLRAQVVGEMNKIKSQTGRPIDLVLAHSLGSLISYDTFVHPDTANDINDKTLITFGSQIGQPGIRKLFGGRIVPLNTGRGHWYHLFNPEDRMLTTRLKISDPEFTQIITDFDHYAPLNHHAIGYLTNPKTIASVYQPIITDLSATGTARGLMKSITVKKLKARKTLNRALLVGVDQYSSSYIPPLSGCVNDTFIYSEILQRRGFEADNIRVLTNERATALRIRQRLEWLLDDAQPGDTRILCFSGHGAQMPGYGENEVVDHVDECLCPHDFSWDNAQTAIADNEFYKLYADLPVIKDRMKGVRFLTIFDCCHSGGMFRGTPSVRGLTPPDDIRHRLLEWADKDDSDACGEWQLRRRFREHAKDPAHAWDKTGEFLGLNGRLRRLGRASVLRALSKPEYDNARKMVKTRVNEVSGAYLPEIISACSENQLAQEYRDGSASYGAFTYTFGKLMRDSSSSKLTISQLILRVKQSLAAIGYVQTPELLPGDDHYLFPDV